MITAGALLKAGERVGNVVYVPDAMLKGHPYGVHIYTYEPPVQTAMWSGEDTPLTAIRPNVVSLEVLPLSLKPVPDHLRLQEGL